MSTLKTNNIQHVDRSDPSIIINTDGSVNIAGTMTYEDVTNVDAVGIITGRSNIDAQKQVHVGTGVSVKAGGINVTAGITTVQALQATSGTFSAAVSGTTGTFSGAVSGTTGTFSAAVSGTTGTFSDNVSVAGNLAVDSGSNGMIDFGDITTAYGRLYADDSNGVLIGSKSNHQLVLRTNNTERVRIDTSGRFLLGHTADIGFGFRSQLVGTDGNTSSFAMTRFTNSASGPTLVIAKSRNGTPGSKTIVSSGDNLGEIQFRGDDGVDYLSIAASINAEVDGTPGAGDMPGRLVFSTTADGAESATERMRITKYGELLIGKTVTSLSTDGLRLQGEGAMNLSRSSTSTVLGTANGGSIALINPSATDNNFSNIGGYNSNSLVTSQINFINTDISNRHGAIAFMVHDGSTLAEKMRITKDGLLRAGSTSNTDTAIRLAIHSSGTSGCQAQFTGSGTGDTSNDGCRVGYNGSGAQLWNFENTYTRFSTNNTERLRIDNGGLVSIGDAISGMDMGFGNQMFNSKSGTYSAQCIGSTSASVTTSIIYNSNTSFGGSVSMCDWRAAASNSSAWYFLRLSSNSASDNEFFLAGDGNAYADGSWSGGGADYAEYFEWSDGNTSDEDRRGMTVVLDGTKIKISTSSDSTDNIIGVVSGNPSMIGDAAYCKWTGKYQRDDYNAYVRDSNGDRVLNSSYDNTLTYLPRKDRKEWDAIGMVGKLRVRKGQQTGTRWIKMKDVSDTIEEWLVR